MSPTPDTTPPVLQCPDGETLSDSDVYNLASVSAFTSGVGQNPNSTNSTNNYDGVIVLSTDLDEVSAVRNFSVARLTEFGFAVVEEFSYVVQLSGPTSSNAFTELVTYSWAFGVGGLEQSGELIIDATDEHGNVAIPCRYAVVIVDTQPPEIDCPSNLDAHNSANADGVTNSYNHPAPASGTPTAYALQTDPNQNFATATLPSPTISDNSEMSGMTVSLAAHRWDASSGGSPTFTSPITWPNS